MTEDHDILIELRTIVKETNEDIKEMKNTLHGNGREGVCDIVVRHDNQITTLFKNHKTDIEGIRSQKKRDLALLSLFIALGVLTVAVIGVVLP